mmetsp:Transcript_122840/g.238916  ORF Transcript_122840/g.238916 Transcript_122840/m.238916 type:complete len:126 (+) Transcript_122840:25-402(+)
MQSSQATRRRHWMDVQKLDAPQSTPPKMYVYKILLPLHATLAHLNLSIHQCGGALAKIEFHNCLVAWNQQQSFFFFLPLFFGFFAVTFMLGSGAAPNVSVAAAGAVVAIGVATNASVAAGAVLAG